MAFYPTFQDYDLFVGGTAVYTALCMSLQFKVMFLHHQFAYPNVIVISLSVVGMLLFFYILNIMPTDYVTDYADEANFMYAQKVYWFYCFFSIPVFVILVDLTGHGYHIFFSPTKENLFREFDLEVRRFLCITHARTCAHCEYNLCTSMRLYEILSIINTIFT